MRNELEKRLIAIFFSFYYLIKQKYLNDYLQLQSFLIEKNVDLLTIYYLSDNITEAR